MSAPGRRHRRFRCRNGCLGSVIGAQGRLCSLSGSDVTAAGAEADAFGLDVVRFDAGVHTVLGSFVFGHLLEEELGVGLCCIAGRGASLPFLSAR